MVAGKGPDDKQTMAGEPDAGAGIHDREPMPPAPPTAKLALEARSEKGSTPAEHQGKLAVVNFPGMRQNQPDGEQRSDAEPDEPVWLRHRIIRWSFLACVALPVLMASAYLTFIAQDQYHSDASFTVRSIDSSSGNDILGLFMQASSGDTISDSYILTEFIRSREMYEAVTEDVDLESAFARRGLDFFFSMKGGLPIEEQLDYWNRMVRVDFDTSSGVVFVRAKAFAPGDAQAIAASVVKNSSELINELSAAARREIVTIAQNEVAAGEARLREARRVLREFRDRTQEVNPRAGAELAAQLIGTLEGELARANSELRTALFQMDSNSPRVRVLSSQIESLTAQITAERARLGSGGDAADGIAAGFDRAVASRILAYEELETEQEFAREAYMSSLATLRSAISDAQRNQRYLATFLSPKLAQQPEYPRRLLLIFLVALGAGFFWTVGVMLYYNLRDRA